MQICVYILRINFAEGSQVRYGSAYSVEEGSPAWKKCASAGANVRWICRCVTFNEAWSLFKMSDSMVRESKDGCIWIESKRAGWRVWKGFESRCLDRIVIPRPPCLVPTHPPQLVHICVWCNPPLSTPPLSSLWTQDHWLFVSVVLWSWIMLHLECQI